MFGQPAASIVVKVKAISETDDNPGNGNRQHAGEPSRIGPACACDAPVKELIAKPTLSHFGFGYTG